MISSAQSPLYWPMDVLWGVFHWQRWPPLILMIMVIMLFRFLAGPVILTPYSSEEKTNQVNRLAIIGDSGVLWGVGHECIVCCI